jgi:ParB family chromosome partitioning protein
VAAEAISVRQLEQLVESPDEPKLSVSPDRPIHQKAAYLRDLEEQFTQKLGTRVSILPGRARNSGRVVIEYYSLDDFDGLCVLLGIKAEG